MVKSYKLIEAQQKAWAYQQGIRYDKDGYTLCLNDNLYCPLSPATREEFMSGKGDELGSSEKRGKMQALHSSSALVANVFEYWRKSGNVDSIAAACGTPQGMTEITFEQTHPIPVSRIPPHLDVEFFGGGLNPMAIESKFTEPYHRHTKRIIKEKYFNTPNLWAQLPRCKELALRIHKEEKGKTSFIYLDAPQLLKHVLGLTLRFGHTGFEILYLWYEMPSAEADRHLLEIKQFKEYMEDEVHFRDMTYQALFEVIKKCPNADKDYVYYLGKRYFPCQMS